MNDLQQQGSIKIKVIYIFSKSISFIESKIICEIFFAVMLLLFPISAIAQDQSSKVVMTCGPSSGFSHYFDKTYSATDEISGWSHDETTDGFTILTQENGEYDVKFGDAVGVHSYKEAGIKLITIAETDRFITLGAFNFGYNATIWTFDTVNYEMLYTVSRIDEPKKVGILMSKCS